MSDLYRTFPFRVRPRHRETFSSLEARILTANAEPLDLPAKLRAEHGLSDAEWVDALHRKNGSTPPQPQDPGVRHLDGATCAQCTDLLPARWMCTLCAGGDRIEQHPHFRSPVCTRHRRWVGFGQEPESQHAVTAPHLIASRRFDRLRRSSRLDPRLYGLLSQHLTAECELSEAQTFPLALNLAAAITHPEFLRRILDPRQTFAAAFHQLKSTVRRHAKRALPDTTRAVWLAMRPAFAAARGAARTGQPYTTAHPHDFPVHPAAVSVIPQMREREPFANFLAQTGDTPLSANTYLGDSYQRLIPGTRSRHLVCRHGHQYTHTAKDGQERCPSCPRHGEATPDVNDIASQSPRLAAQWDYERNGELTPAMVAMSSNISIQWLCAKKRHPFTATPSNRSQNDQGCPVCQNRRILAGANDFATRYPHAFAELSPGYVSRYNPYVLRLTPIPGQVVGWSGCQCELAAFVL